MSAVFDGQRPRRPLVPLRRLHPVCRRRRRLAYRRPIAAPSMREKSEPTTQKDDRLVLRALRVHLSFIICHVYHADMHVVVADLGHGASA